MAASLMCRGGVEVRLTPRPKSTRLMPWARSFGGLGGHGHGCGDFDSANAVGKHL